MRMLTTARFYDLPVSLTTGEYPLFTSGGPPIHHIVQTVENVKVTKDMDQDLIVPTFDGYETISMVYLYGVGWFWVTGVETSTIYNETLVFHLRYAASTSNLLYQDNLKGIWTKTPFRDPHLQQTISSAPKVVGVKVSYPTMSSTTNNYSIIETHETVKTYWVQITSKNYINQSNSVVSNSRLTRYGLFACRQGTVENDWSRKVISGPATDTVYPNIEDCINNVEKYLGITADSIVDISVLPICPYMWSEKVEEITDGDATKTRYSTSLVTSDGLVIEPKIGKDISVVYPILGTKTYKYRCYNLDVNQAWENSGVSIITGYVENPLSLTLSLLERQAVTGSIEVRDWMDNVVGRFPMYGSTRETFMLYFSCDTSGLYTIIKQSTGGAHITLPSLKLPWVGSQWETYKAYSMDTDRLANQYAQQQYDLQYKQDMTNAVFNGVIGAGVGAAVGGPAAGIGALVGGVSTLASGAVSGYLGREQNNLKLQQDQKLTEHRIRSSPGTAYSTTYGINQLDIHERFIGGIYLIAPADLTDATYKEYVAQFGHPAEGVQILTMQEGYYQGRILAAEEMTGTIFTRLQEEFNNGLKFKIIYQME